MEKCLRTRVLGRKKGLNVNSEGYMLVIITRYPMKIKINK